MFISQIQSTSYFYLFMSITININLILSHQWTLFEGLPNQDKTFTLTLFMPNSTFEGLTDRNTLLSFFNENFRDSIKLIGQEKLVSDYFSNRALPLVSVKCSPYHVADKAVILGDAAHAMVPFYGQGKPATTIVRPNNCYHRHELWHGGLQRWHKQTNCNIITNIILK